MENPPSVSSTPSQRQRLDKVRVSDMEIQPPVLPTDDASTVWEWGDLLDFTVDDDLAISWGSADFPDLPEAIPALAPAPAPAPAPEDQPEDPNPNSGRIRKRDPRLTCSNFLAGHIPCACPEMDARLLEIEEEESGHGKKRVKTVRAPPGTARCQVPSCGADIKELKGYHRRHRVCLACANASTVVLDGETKRYCQQCGKFHVLPDFDEGKRSCRRKLERHNNRRRRKPTDSEGVIGKESQREPTDSEGVIGKESQRETQTEDANCDGVAGEDSLQLSGHLNEKEELLESEGGRISTLCSVPDSQNVHSDGTVSFGASGETQMDGRIHDSNNSLSPPNCENKSVYSSMCPTGRISFKLYDWNPAEFPRRLRHQIFQWLANMPVELEGYIRPGCTILTVFIAMPKLMWIKLLEDPVSYVHDFVVVPGRMLSGRGNMLIHLNDMILVKDGTSVIKAKVEVRAPRLHYVHPMCFEAGKPMEFVACGSNLLQSKFRLLVSFSGKYLAYSYIPASPRSQMEGDSACNLDHQLYKIHVPQTEENHFGPAFIEIENESGLSNFLPILIGDKEVCAEMKTIEKRYEESFSLREPNFSWDSVSNTCEAYSLRHAAFSEVILDIAWLLKKPSSELIGDIASQIQRFNHLLNFLISIKSTTILEKVLENLKTMMDNMEFKSANNGGTDADMRQLWSYMDYARDLLSRKSDDSGVLVPQARRLMQKEDLVSQNQSCFQNDGNLVVPAHCQDTEITVDARVGVMVGSASNERSETIPLLSKKAVMKANLVNKLPTVANSCTSGEILRSRSKGAFLRYRPALYLFSAAVVCLGVCAVVFHPHKVSEFAVSIRRCLFDEF